MHELSLSDSLVRVALETPGVREDNLRALNVHVGALSSASASALSFCLALVLEQRGLKDVKVNLVEAPARARCRCGHDYNPKRLWDGCPKCGGFDRETTDGQDVTLDSVEVEDGED